MEIKKKLLIFFGELRTFGSCINHFKDLSSFDIAISTWDLSVQWIDDGKQKVKTENINSDFVLNLCKDIKYSFVHNSNKSFGSNTTNMIYHWKYVLDNIDIQNYDTIILHRCDMISQIDIMEFGNIEQDILYCEPGHTDDNGLWMNDYIFLGKTKIIKKFIDSLELIHHRYPHFPLGNCIVANNIKYEHINCFFSKEEPLNPILVRPHSEDYLNMLHKKGVRYFDIKSGKLYKSSDYFTN